MTFFSDEKQMSKTKQKQKAIFLSDYSGFAREHTTFRNLHHW